jgi:LCP family protein required for cell wall assembly
VKPSRRRTFDWLPFLLAVLLVVLCLLATGLGVVAAPGIMAASQGGRTNLLLVGIDRRAGTSWGFRTDTIMVISLEPDGRAASILSIPRDLQVPIPGHGEDRINTANVWGYSKEDPGAGPALLQATIEGNFGIPIDGYLMVDFVAFGRIVDALGGIDVDVPKALHDTRYPDPRPGDPYAFKTLDIAAGLQHMDGRRALEYARSRMSTTDFDRAKRQQQVLLAIRQKALRLDAIPRWPSLAATVLDSVKTDMSAGKLLAVAFSALTIEPSRLKQAVLEPPLVVAHRRADGAAVQLPQWERIDPLLDDLFGPR